MIQQMSFYGARKPFFYSKLQINCTSVINTHIVILIKLLVYNSHDGQCGSKNK